MEITKIKIGSNIYDVKDVNAIGSSDVTKIVNQEIYGSETKPSGATVVTSQNITTIAQAAGIGGSGADGDTKNTAGATNYASTKLFLVGSTEQSANPLTYTNINCYIGADNNLYTNGAKTVNATEVNRAIYTELYGQTTKPSGVSVVTTLNINTALSNAGISTGGASTYSQLSYTTSSINGSGALTIPGTDPIYVVTVSANISSVALQNNPAYGHSCHVIFKSADSSSYTVMINNDNTDRICPTSDGVTLTVPEAGTGYIEVNFLNAGNSTVGDLVYVRGV